MPIDLEGDKRYRPKQINRWGRGSSSPLHGGFYEKKQQSQIMSLSASNTFLSSKHINEKRSAKGDILINIFQKRGVRPFSTFFLQKARRVRNLTNYLIPSLSLEGDISNLVTKKGERVENVDTNLMLAAARTSSLETPMPMSLLLRILI
ncbi:hypothetical protein Tco_0759168 [Tanacetum coccineum]